MAAAAPSDRSSLRPGPRGFLGLADPGRQLRGALTRSLLDDHVTLRHEGVDWLLLNGYVPTLQTPEGLARFVRDQPGVPTPSWASARRRRSLVRFERAQRKEAVAQPCLDAAERPGREGVVPMAAFTATQRNDVGFSTIFRFVITPLFLFSGTFFPIERLPEALQPVAWLTPLYHGVALTRGLALGTLDPAGAAVHSAVLLAFFAAGAAGAAVTFRRALVT